jgi:hypothetical protein
MLLAKDTVRREATYQSMGVLAKGEHGKHFLPWNMISTLGQPPPSQNEGMDLQ